MSREAWGDPPDPEPQRCPVCDGEWHAEGCELGEEVSRRLKAETEARTLRCRYAVVSGWIVEALKVLDTLDPEDTTEADELHKLIKAGEVLALTALALWPLVSTLWRPDGARDLHAEQDEQRGDGHGIGPGR